VAITTKRRGGIIFHAFPLKEYETFVLFHVLLLHTSSFTEDESFQKESRTGSKTGQQELWMD
jgi:hypothetical protein